MKECKEYKVSYEDNILIITEGNKVIVTEVISEKAMIDDAICELYEEGVLPLDFDSNVIYN